MKTKFYSVLFSLLFLLVHSFFAQNTFSYFPAPIGEQTLNSNDAEHPCITESQYEILQKRCAENRKMLNFPVAGTNKMETAVTLLDWPLKPSPDLHDCSYYRISAYVDQNTAAAATQDFNCGTNTYDGHRGTDIATWPYNFIKMDSDWVEVIAAAPGTILDVHDGEFDKNCTSNSMTANYVMIQHADGSTALYWHMKKNSVTTKIVGQTVVTGEHLGMVGSSGSSSGPHLHFEVWSAGTVATRVDPYYGTCNLLNGSTWWNAQKPHKETGVVKVSVNTTDIVVPPCPATEIPNESSVYQIPFQGAGLPPGYAKFYIFIRDEVNSLTGDLKILNPDNSTYLSWAYNSTADRGSLMWGWSKILPTNPGTYTFQGTYNGVTCSTTFDIVTPTINPGFEISGLKVYPNPSKGKVMIESKLVPGREIEIFNLTGQIVYRTKLENPLTEIELAVKPGIYFYRVADKGILVDAGKLLVEY